MKKKIIRILMLLVIIIGCIMTYKAINRLQSMSLWEACTLEDNFYEISLFTKWHKGGEIVWEFYKYNDILYYISTVHYLFRNDRHPELFLDSYLYSYNCQTKIAKNMNIDNHGFYKIHMIQWRSGSIIMNFEGLIEGPSPYFMMDLDDKSLKEISLEEFSGLNTTVLK